MPGTIGDLGGRKKEFKAKATTDCDERQLGRALGTETTTAAKTDGDTEAGYMASWILLDSWWVQAGRAFHRCSAVFQRIYRESRLCLAPFARYNEGWTSLFFSLFISGYFFSTFSSRIDVRGSTFMAFFLSATCRIQAPVALLCAQSPSEEDGEYRFFSSIKQGFPREKIRT